MTAVDQGWLPVPDAEGATTRCDAGTVLETARVAAALVADLVAHALDAEQDRMGRVKVGRYLRCPRS